MNAMCGDGAGDAPLLCERRDGVLVMTLNRPTVRNAVNRAMAEAMAATLDELDADDELSAAVLTGAGGGFSAGMDLKAFASGERPHAGGRGFAGIVERPPAKPLIAAVEGFAVAGGLEIALACDVIVAARDARLGVPEVKRGLVPAGGALLRLPRRMPSGMAMRLVLTGDLVEAGGAAATGLVDCVTEPGDALPSALALGDAIAANAPLAIAAAKRVLTESRGWPAGEFWERQREITEPVIASEDAREGALAFRERRDPVWRRA